MKVVSATAGKRLDNAEPRARTDGWRRIAGQAEVTPAFVLDVGAMVDAARQLARTAEQLGLRALYAVKALAVPEIVRAIAKPLDGLAVSSLAEAQLARCLLTTIGDERRRTLQLTAPGLRDDEFDELAELCDTLVFNSLSQLDRFGERAASAGAASALRINPELSWLNDDRYDPCRAHSQLGVPLTLLADNARRGLSQRASLVGLHFHTNHRATSTEPIAATIHHLVAHIRPLLAQVEWLNVGGGYELTEMDETALLPLARAAEWLRNELGTRLIVEPGGTLVRRHGWLVASVIDLFTSDGESIAILDTSVAHLSELFEYQRPATIFGHNPAGGHAYTLAGGSCLAGDRFGRFCFDEPLALGQRVVFANVGAYALSKVQQFNGIQPPAVLLLSEAWPT